MNNSSIFNTVEVNSTAKKDVYAYFNNTMGNAFENAVSLNAKVQKAVS